jgi:hypothetical protein
MDMSVLMPVTYQQDQNIWKCFVLKFSTKACHFELSHISCFFSRLSHNYVSLRPQKMEFFMYVVNR